MYSATSLDQLPHMLAALLMFGNQLLMAVPDVDRCDLFICLGANPLASNGSIMTAPDVRGRLDAIEALGGRVIVLDPRRTETAELADIHLQVRPGTDAWCLAALGAVLVEEDLIDRPWLAAHADQVDEVVAHLGKVPIAEFCAVAGVDESLVRAAARRIGNAASVAFFEDLGVQMSLHSTLSSYLEKLLWLLTGNFAKPGAQYAPTSLVNLAGGAVSGGGSSRRSPVAGARIISGLVPANVIAEEILTDHPDRYRAMLVESGNPAHSLADSQHMREALGALELLVVIDVAMTETARLADYVLPEIGRASCRERV